MHLKVFTKCQMLCNAYDDMSGFSILNTRGVTGSMQKHAFHLDPLKNVLLLHWGEHKNMLVSFSINQINALSSCCYLSKVLLQKRGMGYARFIHKKRWKKVEKMNKCPRYLKQWVLRCPPEKKKKKERKRKIAHVLL